MDGLGGGHGGGGGGGGIAVPRPVYKWRGDVVIVIVRVPLTEREE